MPSPVFIETGLSSSPSKQRLSSSSMMKKMCSCGYLQDMGNLFATMIVLPFLFDYKLGRYDHIQPRTDLFEARSAHDRVCSQYKSVLC